MLPKTNLSLNIVLILIALLTFANLKFSNKKTHK